MSTPATKSEAREAKKLRARILELTGHEPAGPSAESVRYLRRRLATIEARMDAGADVRHRNLDAALFTISMPKAGCDAFDFIVENETKKRGKKTNRSKLGREALASWARSQGYTDAATAIEEGTDG